MNKLSIRLAMIADMVQPCHIMADIGADHGYLACALVQTHKCVCAYAMDIAKGPLSAACQTIESNGLTDKVIPILSDGLTNLPSDVDTIVIAGMGAHTIIDILEAHPDKVKQLDQIIVSANKDPWTIRHWIMDHGYTILDERCCYEGHDYVAIRFDLTTKAYANDPKVRYLGEKLMMHHDDATRLYYQHLLDGLHQLLSKVKDKNRLNSIHQQIEWLNQWFEDDQTIGK